MSRSHPSGAPMCVLCALPEELRLFRTEVADARVEVHGGVEVILGTLDGIAVALAETGLGKVNAAATATLLCDRYACDRILLSGVAGALDPSLAIGDVVVGTRIIQHDYGRLTDDGLIAYRPGEMPFPGGSDHVGGRWATTWRRACARRSVMSHSLGSGHARAAHGTSRRSGSGRSSPVTRSSRETASGETSSRGSMRSSWRWRGARSCRWRSATARGGSWFAR